MWCKDAKTILTHSMIRAQNAGYPQKTDYLDSFQIRHLLCWNLTEAYA